MAPPLPQGVVEQDVFKGEGERSVVQLLFSGPLEQTSRATELRLNALAGVLDIMLREKLREELGGVYSSSVYAFTQDVPEPGYFISISFGTDPARVQELVDAVFAQIEDLQNNGPSASNVEKVTAQQSAEHEEKMQQNSFWLSNLKDYLVYGDEDKLSTLRPEFQATIDALSAASIQADAQEFLRPDSYIQVTLFPESYAPAGQSTRIAIFQEAASFLEDFFLSPGMIIRRAFAASAPRWRRASTFLAGAQWAAAAAWRLPPPAPARSRAQACAWGSRSRSMRSPGSHCPEICVKPAGLLMPRACAAIQADWPSHKRILT